MIYSKLKRRAIFILVVLVLSSAMPTCASYKAEITRSFAKQTRGGQDEVYCKVPKGKTNDAHYRQEAKRT